MPEPSYLSTKLLSESPIPNIYCTKLCLKTKKHPSTMVSDKTSLDRAILITLYTTIGIFTAIMLLRHLARLYVDRHFYCIQDIEACPRPLLPKDTSAPYGTFSLFAEDSDGEGSENGDGWQKADQTGSWSSEDSGILDGVTEMQELLSLKRLALPSLKDRIGGWRESSG